MKSSVKMVKKPQFVHSFTAILVLIPINPKYKHLSQAVSLFSGNLFDFSFLLRKFKNQEQKKKQGSETHLIAMVTTKSINNFVTSISVNKL